MGRVGAVRLTWWGCMVRLPSASSPFWNGTIEFTPLLAMTRRNWGMMRYYCDWNELHARVS